MTSSRPEGQSDFLDAATLQKLIIAAMKGATDKNPQELASLLYQISTRYNAANSYVRSEVAELIQELKNLVGDFEAPILSKQSITVSSRSNTKNRFAAFAVAGFAGVVTISAIAVTSVGYSNGIAPSQPASVSTEAGTNPSFACEAVNPNLVKVEGYSRSNGTYVKPHLRTAPNQTEKDNIICRR